MLSETRKKNATLLVSLSLYSLRVSRWTYECRIPCIIHTFEGRKRSSVTWYWYLLICRNTWSADRCSLHNERVKMSHIISAFLCCVRKHTHRICSATAYWAVRNNVQWHEKCKHSSSIAPVFIWIIFWLKTYHEFSSHLCFPIRTIFVAKNGGKCFLSRYWHSSIESYFFLPLYRATIVAQWFELRWQSL